MELLVGLLDRSPEQHRAILHKQYDLIRFFRDDAEFVALLYHPIQSTYNRRVFALQTERIAMVQSFVAYDLYGGTDTNQKDVFGKDYIEKRDNYLESYGNFCYIYG